MELDELVLADLKTKDLHGVRIVSLDCQQAAVRITFEIGNVTVRYTTANEERNQLNAVVMTSTKDPCRDDEAIKVVRDWTKYVSSILHPIVRQHRTELEALTTTEVRKQDEAKKATEIETPKDTTVTNAVESQPVVETDIIEAAKITATPKPTNPMTGTGSHSAANFQINELRRILAQTEQELVGTRQELADVYQELSDVQQNETSLRQRVGQEAMITAEAVPMRKKVLRVVGNIVFYVVLIAVVLGVALFGLQEPDAAPRSLGGYSVMTVLSGSMRPTIPVRSLVVINGNVNPNDLEVDDVITHLLPNNTTITHRIIGIEENYRGFGERGFRLQGDNNSLPDREIILARNVIGRVTFHNLFLGQTVFFIQENIILIVIFGVLGAALIVVIKKFFLIKDEEELELEQAIENDEVDEPSTTTNRLIVEEEFQTRKRNWKKPVQLSLLVLLIGSFGYSAYRVLAYQALYSDLEEANEALRTQYLQTITIDGEDEEIETALPNRTFLAVDWDGLLARNQDVVAWIHMPGTNINYPVLAGTTNEEYLRLDLDRQHSVAGSIFLEENNANNFADLNTILYGHHMFNGSKFADIHAFIDGTIRIDDVPYIYLYLPDGRVSVYQIIGAHLTTIHSPIYQLPVTDLTAFHELIAADNQLTVAFELDLNARILTLSTCAETGIANEVRSVIFGVLIEER